MSRLSDRAFHLVRSEVEHRFCQVTAAPPDKSFDCSVQGNSQSYEYPGDPLAEQFNQQQLDRLILLSRLETLRAQSGRPMTRAELWEQVSDIAPDLDPDVLIAAASVDSDSPLLGASIGIGAVAVLVATAMGVDTLTLETAKIPRAVSTGGYQAAGYQAVAQGTTGAEAFKTAKQFGWQAALKGQNPPHSSQHWGEAAALWRQALVHLDQVPRHDPNYPAAQAKKAFYQENLAQVEMRQMEAQIPAPAPVFAATQGVMAQPQDLLKSAKDYGWQAAVASQEGPHPAEKWADISRLWQLALQQLDRIEAGNPQYAEAQAVKARYQKNLQMIRQRYQQEQAASQRLRSLQATLAEISGSPVSLATKSEQVRAIAAKLATIPPGTLAYRQAQALIADMNSQADAPPRPYLASSRMAGQHNR